MTVPPILSNSKQAIIKGTSHTQHSLLHSHANISRQPGSFLTTSKLNMLLIVRYKLLLTGITFDF